MNQTTPDAIEWQLLTPNYASVWPLSPFAWLVISLTIVLIIGIILFISYAIKQKKMAQRIKCQQSMWLTKFSTISSLDQNSERLSSQLAEILLSASQSKHLQQMDLDFYQSHKTLFDCRYNGQTLSPSQKQQLIDVCFVKLKELAPWN